MSIWDKLDAMVQLWLAPLTQWFLRLFRQICNHTSKVITTHWKMTGALVLKSFACWSTATALRRLVFQKFDHVSSVLQDLNNIKITRLLMRCYLPLINALRQASQSHWRCSHLELPAWKQRLRLVFGMSCRNRVAERPARHELICRGQK